MADLSRQLIDTHCHLGLAAFDADRGEVVARARAAQVVCAVVVGQNDAENRRVLELAGSEPRGAAAPFIRPAAGLHPEYASDAEAELCIAFARAHQDRLAALGEVGLDFFRAQSEEERRVQTRVFARFIALGLETGLGLTVHSRSAGHYAVDALLDGGALKAVLHAFDGKHRYAEKGAAAGLGFSIPPSIVRSRQKQELVRALPLAALLLESDAPVLGPDRAARNEPANVVFALEAIAALKGVGLDEAAAVTAANARRYFRL